KIVCSSSYNMSSFVPWPCDFGLYVSCVRERENLLTVSSERKSFTVSPAERISFPKAFFPFNVMFFFLSILYRKLFGAWSIYFPRNLSRRCPASFDPMHSSFISCLFLHGNVKDDPPDRLFSFLCIFFFYCRDIVKPFRPCDKRLIFIQHADGKTRIAVLFEHCFDMVRD